MNEVKKKKKKMKPAKLKSRDFDQRDSLDIKTKKMEYVRLSKIGKSTHNRLSQLQDSKNNKNE